MLVKSTLKGLVLVGLLASVTLAASAKKSKKEEEAPHKPAGEGWVLMTMKLTAYCNEEPEGCKICCGKWAKHNRTASGKRPEWGMLAADKSLLPFGTKVVIPGYKTQFVVEDTGSAIKGRRLDVCFGTKKGAHERAKKFGVQTKQVWTQKPKPKKK